MLPKSKSIRFLLILLTASFLQSCTKDLPFDFSDSEKKLVINSIFYPYEHFTIRITSSRNILDPDSEIEQVSNLYVVLANEKGETLEVLKEVGSSGVYVSEDVVAFPGATYELTVKDESASNRLTYKARSSIPIISEETRIDTSYVSTTNGTALKVDVLIDDAAEENEVYIFEVEIRDQGLVKLAELITYDESVESYSDQDYPRRLFLGDSDFAGQKRSLDFLTYEGLPREEQEEAEIKMLNASPELDKYYRSLEEYKLSQQTINPGLNSPVKVFSNIERDGDKLGLGIFAGANKKTLKIKH